jgi:hypothetical protein
VVELGAGTQQSASESATHAGALPTLMLIQILAELERQKRLHPIAQPRVEGPSGMLAACRDAASRRGWVIVDGEWTVSEQPLALRLVRAAQARSDLGEHELVVQAVVPAIADELTPTGRVRLTSGQRIAANTFGHIERWSEDDRQLTVIALAAFARVGDPRFQWRGASFGDNANGDF